MIRYGCECSLLARALQALSNPNCQSSCLSVCRQLWCWISRKLKDLCGSCPMGPYRKVPTARGLVTSSMTSRDYDIINVTS